MTFATRNIILSHDTNIVMCHNKDLTCDNNFFLQKKETKSDTWRIVNYVT